MFKNPEELKYTKTHEWVKEEDGYCVVGLTDYAQDALGDIVFVNVPSVDDAVTAGEVFCDVRQGGFRCLLTGYRCDLRSQRSLKR